MKILQIIPDLELAGAETMCLNLSIELSKDIKNDVRVISFYSKETAIVKKLKDKGIKVYLLDKKIGFDFSMVFKIKKILKEFSPDVIHSHRYALTYIIPATILKMKKYKIVHTIHNIADKDAKRNLRLFQGYFFKHRFITPVALTEEIKKTVVNCYKINEDIIPVVYNGIDLSNCLVKNNYTESEKILHIGRFDVAKNHLTFIREFKKFSDKYPSIKLYLIGDGRLKPEITSLVEELKLNDKVICLGLIENVYPYLNEADIFILPSIFEGMPMTIIEAMGTGLPVVATNVGGISNMISNEKDGLLLNDCSELNEALEKLYKNKNLRKKLGTSAKIKCKKFSSVEMCKNYMKIYNG